MEKLKRILDMHGVIYIEYNGKFDCYCYSGDKMFDTLEVIGNQLYINGKSETFWIGLDIEIMQKNVDKAFFLPYNTYKQTHHTISGGKFNVLHHQRKSCYEAIR